MEAFKHRPELIEAYIKGSWDILSGANLVIKPDWIKSVINKRLANATSGVLITCDPARFGDDETVIYAMRGAEVINSCFYGQKSTMDTAGRCAAMRKKYNAELILVDGVGIGGGVVDRLMELDEPVKEVNFANKPSNEIKQEKYYNLRAEVYWEAAEMFSDGNVSIPDDLALKQQLGHIQYYNASKGRIKIESKDDIKKRLGGGSPDRADALVMGLWGVQFLTSTYNDYNRMGKGKPFDNINPLYAESLGLIGGQGYQSSDYEGTW